MSDLEWNEKEIELLREVFPHLAQQLRFSMANLFLAAGRIATPEAREKDPALDANAAALTMSYYQMLRLLGNLTDAGSLLKETPLLLSNNDIVGLCREICQKAEGLFALKGVTLSFQSDLQSHIVACNAAAVERLLLNLLSNALLYTPKGGSVTLGVRVAKDNVLISVSDTGCGIAQDKLDTVFSRFLHPEALDTAPHGMGLGLALCRRIALAHGGNLLAQSTLGKGTTFTFSLPSRRTTTQALKTPQFEYGGGFNHYLVELSDALPPEAFLQKYLD